MKVVMTCVGLLIGLAVLGCGKKDDSSDIEETGQQVGDLMAGVDESSGSNAGTFASLSTGHEKALARLEGKGGGSRFAWILTPWVPEAVAASCGVANTFSSCSANTIVRDFGDCSIGGAVLSGSVTLSWGGGAAACQMTASGHTVSRNPNFTLTGRRGATLTVVKTGANGQVITRGASAGSYSFTNDGIRRSFARPSGEKLFDFSTETTSAISVSGQSRASRVLSGGSIKVTNHLSGVTCDVVPSAVSWAAGCNCAVSGNWAGTCSDGKSFSMEVTGCGSAALSLGSESQSFNFDRCYAI